MFFRQTFFFDLLFFKSNNCEKIWFKNDIPNFSVIGSVIKTISVTILSTDSTFYKVSITITPCITSSRELDRCEGFIESTTSFFTVPNEKYTSRTCSLAVVQNLNKNFLIVNSVDLNYIIWKIFFLKTLILYIEL